MRAKKYQSLDNVVVRIEGKLKKDYSGKDIGYFTILKHVGFNFRSKSVYLVKDIFGAEFLVTANQIVQKYFGRRFYIKESIAKCKKLRFCYYNMIRRCYDKNCPGFMYYGGKGIKIYSDWLDENGRINFIKWAAENGYQLGLTIDRINSNADYIPENCVWVTKAENSRRTSRCILNLEIAAKIRKQFVKVPKHKKLFFFKKWINITGASLSNIKSICYSARSWN